MASRRLERPGVIPSFRPISGSKLKAMSTGPDYLSTFKCIRPAIALGATRHNHPAGLVHALPATFRVRRDCFSATHISNFSIALRTELFSPAITRIVSRCRRSIIPPEDAKAGTGPGPAAYPPIQDRSLGAHLAKYDADIFPGAVRSPGSVDRIITRSSLHAPTHSRQEFLSIKNTFINPRPVPGIVTPAQTHLSLEQRIIRHISTKTRPETTGILPPAQNAKPQSGSWNAAAVPDHSPYQAPFRFYPYSEPGPGMPLEASAIIARPWRIDGSSIYMMARESVLQTSLEEGRRTHTDRKPVSTEQQPEITGDLSTDLWEDKKRPGTENQPPRRIVSRMSIIAGIPSRALAGRSNHIVGLQAINFQNMAGIMVRQARSAASAITKGAPAVRANSFSPDDTGLMPPSPDKGEKKVPRVFRYGASTAMADEAQVEVRQSLPEERSAIYKQQIVRSGPAQPVIRPQDLDRISDQICSIIERRLKIEKERRGIYG